MRPSDVLEKNREAIRALAVRHRVANPRVFGSVARGEDREDSDVDILVDTLEETTLFDLGGLQHDLETLLQMRVDLATSKGLRQKIRDRVLAEAIAI
ncbi:nucleotidyltransferase family protein [Rhizobium oryzicola]|uniref:Nucleotidyltransferase family protein n=1 Tax=Rhizobium oryzicola TaxID=1232668 RepID=A0ABT8SW23_9HYPH|nr:nucleotidyltransferase family protein [Rhizobium oryzicola]MDO1582231.1 nucleotidyltransferase family protein [Rhizobium oryzicola]